LMKNTEKIEIEGFIYPCSDISCRGAIIYPEPVKVEHFEKVLNYLEKHLNVNPNWVRDDIRASLEDRWLYCSNFYPIKPCSEDKDVGLGEKAIELLDLLDEFAGKKVKITVETLKEGQEKKKMRVIVCGSRFWKDVDIIRRELEKLPPDTIIIHGGANGADRIAGKIATQLGFKVVVFEAEWDKYGKAAGVIRNQRMIDEGKPDLILAFHNNILQSKGTKDMLLRGLHYGIPVKLIRR